MHTPNFVQKLAIKIFNLENYNQLFAVERNKQKQIDEVEKLKELKKLRFELESKRQMEVSSLNYTIKELQAKIELMEKKEEEVNERDLLNKLQLQANIHIASLIYMKTYDLSEEVIKKTAAIKGLVNRAIYHKNNLEKKGKTSYIDDSAGHHFGISGEVVIEDTSKDEKLIKDMIIENNEEFLKTVEEMGSRPIFEDIKS